MKIRKLLISFALIIGLSVCALALDFNGYIVEIKEDAANALTQAAMFSDTAILLEGMTDEQTVDFIVEAVDEADEVSSKYRLITVEDEQTLEMLKQMGVVSRYEPNVLMELFDTYDVTANPDYTGKQQWAHDAVNSRGAWNLGIYGEDVKVAVIDSGVAAHNDIKNNLLPGYNYADGATDVKNTTDNNGHGTFVAGLVAAQCNTINTVGVAFNAKIVPLKVTDTSTFNISSAITAIIDAVETYNCDVMNLSFGITQATLDKPENYNISVFLKDAVDRAENAGVIVVAAAGNKGNSGYQYPASYDSVISVANVMQSVGGYSVSSTSQQNDRIDIAAPGTAVYSLSNYSNGTRFSQTGGTSYASPLVAGAAALAKSINPDISPAAFREIVKRTANKSYMTAEQGSEKWGAGLLDVGAVVKEVIGGDTYVSDITNASGKHAVTVYNLRNEAKQVHVIMKEYDALGKLSMFEIASVTVSANGSVQLILSDYGFSNNVIIKAVTDHIPGDINGDGKSATMKDVNALMRYYAGYRDSSTVVAALDVTGDGKVNMSDAYRLLQKYAGYFVEIN